MEEIKPYKHSKETRNKISKALKGHKNHATHGLTNTKIYGMWSTMKSRCYNKNREGYKNYGGRGISICDEWLNDFSVFYEWAIKSGYENGLEIDRIDNNGNYSPNNCRFVASKQNSRNRRNAKLLTINGETKCVAEWCEHIEISSFTVYWWIRKGGKSYAEQRLSKLA